MRTATIRQVTNGYIVEQQPPPVTDLQYAQVMSGYASGKATNVFGSLEDALISVAKFMAPDAKNVVVNVKS
jgi:hypothetical protein